jgi:hypothetical protein
MPYVPKGITGYDDDDDDDEALLTLSGSPTVVKEFYNA